MELILTPFPSPLCPKDGYLFIKLRWSKRCGWVGNQTRDLAADQGICFMSASYLTLRTDEFNSTLGCLNIDWSGWSSMVMASTLVAITLRFSRSSILQVWSRDSESLDTNSRCFDWQMRAPTATGTGRNNDSVYHALKKLKSISVLSGYWNQVDS